MNRKARGFTLIELLVVIAIISLLAAIAVPAVQGRIRRANMTRAEADISTIEQAVVSFIADAGVPPWRAAVTGSVWQSMIDQVGGGAANYTILLSEIFKSTELYCEPTDFGGLSWFKGPICQKVQITYLPEGIPLDPWGNRYIIIPGNARERDADTRERFLRLNSDRGPIGRPSQGKTVLDLPPNLEVYILSRGEDGELNYLVETGDVYEGDDISNYDSDRGYTTWYR